MVKKDFYQTKSVHMAVQTAELNLLGYNLEQELSLSCSLMNISRGHCVIKVKPFNLSQSNKWGELEISIDRPVMKAEVPLCMNRFSELCVLLNSEASRPVTVVMMLNAPLSVNLAGDLLINSAAKLKITDLSWIIPLK